MATNNLERTAPPCTALRTSEAFPQRRRVLSGSLALALIALIGVPSFSADGDSARPTRRKPKRNGDKFEEITFDDLKLDLGKDEPFQPEKLTDRVKELDKGEIRIRGYILPASVFQQKDIPKFVLVRDNMECCFGPGAALHDSIIVEMESGETTDFTTRPVAVEGVFQIKEFKYPDGKYYAIYHLRGSSVK